MNYHNPYCWLYEDVTKIKHVCLLDCNFYDISFFVIIRHNFFVESSKIGIQFNVKFQYIELKSRHFLLCFSQWRINKTKPGFFSCSKQVHFVHLNICYCVKKTDDDILILKSRVYAVCTKLREARLYRCVMWNTKMIRINKTN